MRLTRLVLPVLTVLVSGLAVSACGVSQESIHPGVAAKVGSQTIKLTTVDDAVEPTCDILKAQPQLLGGGYTGEGLRTIVLTQLALRAFADQLAAEYDVDGEQLYRAAADATRTSLTAGSEADIDVALPVFASSNYATSVIDAVITRQLGGSTDGQVRQAAAQAILAKWQEQHPIETNPLFGTIEFGAQETTDNGKRSDLSVAVTGIAKNADAASPSAEQIATLPVSQRCTA